MLAIVIPFYKITFFEETLASVASQTNKRFKLYIGNDGSNENPAPIIEKYSQNINLKYIAYKNNLGKESLVSHWNRCIEMIEAEEWILILGDDDILAPNVVESFYRSIEDQENVLNVIRFSTVKISDTAAKISQRYNHPKKEKSPDFLFKNVRSSLSEYVFRTSQVKKIGFKDFPLAWYSDVLAVLEFSNFNEVLTINEACVHVRISELSISGSEDHEAAKAQAKFEFYYYLLSTQIKNFSPIQVDELFHRINKSYLNEKKKIIYFYKISGLYFSNNKVKNYFNFLGLILGGLVKSLK